MDEYETTYEPMDVDMSASSNDAMDISYTYTDAELSRISNSSITPKVIREQKLNKKSCQENQDKNFEKGEIKSRSHRPLLIMIMICLLSIVSYNIFTFKCFESFNLKSINKRLHTRIYGQTLAIENVVDFLNLEDNIKVLVLYGGTGVGKTFMVSLLIEDLYNHTNIYYYSMTSFENIFPTESMFGVTLCKSSIVIIDDLTIDIEISRYLKELIARSSNLNKSITIILVYNCANIDKQFIAHCPNNFLSKLNKSFIDINVMKKFVKFEPLTEDALKKCIEYELRDYNINNMDLDKMVRNFNVKRDGCKGVHQKTKYFNIIE